MSKKKNKQSTGGKPAERLERRDIHKHPTQGTQPYEGDYRHHVGVQHAPWHPFGYAPMVGSTRAAGAGGFGGGGGGLHGPFTGIGPKGYARSDGRVLEDVCDLLTAHGELDVGEVDVHCRDGIIRLEGDVPDRRTRLMIAQVADTVLGVVRVQNDLQVAGAA